MAAGVLEELVELVADRDTPNEGSIHLRDKKRRREAVSAQSHAAAFAFQLRQIIAPRLQRAPEEQEVEVIRFQLALGGDRLGLVLGSQGAERKGCHRDILPRLAPVSSQSGAGAECSNISTSCARQ